MFDKDTYTQLLRKSLRGETPTDIPQADATKKSLLENPKDLEFAIAVIKDSKDSSTSQLDSSKINKNKA